VIARVEIALGRDRLGGERVRVHLDQRRHLRARKLHEQQPHHDPVGHHQGRQEDHEVAEAPVHHQDHDGAQAQRHDGHEGGGQDGDLRGVGEHRRAGLGDEGEDRLVGRLKRDAALTAPAARQGSSRVIPDALAGPLR
jgi:hypothetical protein